MNITECDILRTLSAHPGLNQRALSAAAGHSLGMINRAVHTLREGGYLDASGALTTAGQTFVRAAQPRRAIILAAGFGMRMVPINTEMPKALLTVCGEVLIERQIRQLREAGVEDIYVVTGFMKEQFEYLIDDFGVHLLVNPQYAVKNNLHSLYAARDNLADAYIVPCDIYCRENPFSCCEPYSWYMLSDRIVSDGGVRVSRRGEVMPMHEHKPGQLMIGIAYLNAADAVSVRERLDVLSADPAHDGDYWEEALYVDGRMCVPARIVPDTMTAEINTYEQLRSLDSDSGSLQSGVIDAIAQTFGVKPADITEITVLKKGMTNRSFIFRCGGKKYIMRVPGEGTEQLINRRNEAAVYAAIAGCGLCDDVVYINPDTGYKITAFLDGVRVADPHDIGDITRCMTLLRQFHRSALTVGHRFDLFGQIAFYETLRGNIPSAYRDFERTRDHVYSLRPYIEAHAAPEVLTHIDAICDNFLFSPDGHGGERLQLTDWEYAGMQDPHVDLAMFAIYSYFERDELDALIDVYFEGCCDETTRTKIYCYVAACGLLWSNWCEFKSTLGVEFGEYSLKQYRYAKDFYRLAAERIQEEG